MAERLKRDERGGARAFGEVRRLGRADYRLGDREIRDCLDRLTGQDLKDGWRDLPYAGVAEPIAEPAWPGRSRLRFGPIAGARWWRARRCFSPRTRLHR